MSWINRFARNEAPIAPLMAQPVVEAWAVPHGFPEGIAAEGKFLISSTKLRLPSKRIHLTLVAWLAKDGDLLLVCQPPARVGEENFPRRSAAIPLRVGRRLAWDIMVAHGVETTRSVGATRSSRIKAGT